MHTIFSAVNIQKNHVKQVFYSFFFKKKQKILAYTDNQTNFAFKIILLNIIELC